MRSRKVEPCAAVMRTLIRSDSTRVPPVTAERSPPLSRITGRDSPVIADSSTEATPSTISPSAGIRSPASTRTRSPSLSVWARTGSNCRRRPAAAWPWSRCACAASVAACALPRPSATASAKVGEQHRDPQPGDDLDREADVRRAADEVAHQEHGGEHGHHLDDEHDRVLRPARAGRACGSSRARRASGSPGRAATATCLALGS